MQTRCGASGSIRACHAAGPGSILGRDKFPGCGFSRGFSSPVRQMSGSFRPQGPRISFGHHYHSSSFIRAPMTWDVDTPLNLKYTYITCKIFKYFPCINNVISDYLIGFQMTEIHYRSYISMPLAPILCKAHPVPSITTHLLQIHFNIILPSISRPP